MISQVRQRFGLKIGRTHLVILTVVTAVAVCAIAAVAVERLGRPAKGVSREPIYGVASIIDGDTIEVHGTRIRLHGIDAPERRQLCQQPDGAVWRCGQQSALALADHIGRSVVQCEPRGRDRYSRIVAVCFLDSEDLDRWMVSTGWAVAFRKYSMDYVADEDRARRGRVGIWSGTFDMPWDWRAAGKH